MRLGRAGYRKDIERKGMKYHYSDNLIICIILNVIGDELDFI